MKSTLTVLLAGLLFFIGTVHAEVTSEAWNAYLAGDFDRVAEIVQKGLLDTTLTDSTRSSLYFTLGCSKAIQGNDAMAIDYFRTAFKLHPSLKHNSLELPPPVWRVFKPVQDSVQATLILKSFPAETPKNLQPNEPSKIVKDTIRIYEPKSHPQQGVVRSLVFPGWGHLYEGDSKGYRFVIGEAILVASFVWSLQATLDAEEKYLSERDTKSIVDRYSDYNTRYKLTWGLGASMVGVYLFAQWDYFHIPPYIAITSLNSDGIQVGFHFAVN